MQIIDALGFAPEERHGPLPRLLLVLTLITGLVDAVSYLKLGHVFVANMTGNVVFLGFAVGGAAEFSIAASLWAIAAFLAGALAGGRLGVVLGNHRGRLFASAIYLMIALVAAALCVSLLAPDPDGELAVYILITLLASAMGIQNATARRLGVPDLTTTVLTLTLTGLAADSPLAGGHTARPGRRVVATLAMFLGGAIGALLILKIGSGAALTLVVLLLFAVGIAGHRHAASAATWTAGT
jgi:uncharacterized membrane protein YoaK (UPF0700 family)